MNTTGRDWAGEYIVQVILDPSILSSWCEVKDESALDKLFSISRSLCYAMHAKRSALLDSHLPEFYLCVVYILTLPFIVC